MMGAADLFKEALGDLPEADITFNTVAAKALIRAGLAVVLCHPGSKRPACTLDARAAKKADLEAQADAQAAGNRYWHKVKHECGKKHLITELKDLNRARIKKLLADGANVGVMAGAGTTRLLIADLDTTEQRRAFIATWERETGEDFTDPMTVSSPGVRNVAKDGTEQWIHKDGGHYWLIVPDDVEIPPGVSVYEGEGGWKVYVRDSYALVPPSVRPEGPYLLTGGVLEAPAWLLDRLQAQAVEAAERKEKALERLKDGPQDIDDWAAVTPWTELLEAAGWRDAQAHDTCGCPIWTRPGNPAHIKSATAHEAGCSRYDTSLGYGPIHAWSDEVRWGGSQTVNKLTFLAWTKHDGDMVAAMRSIGVEPRGMDLPILDPFQAPPAPGPDREEVTPPMGDQTPPAATTSHEITGDRSPAELEAAIYRLYDRMTALDARTRRAWPETHEEMTARELERIRAREAAKALYEREISRPEDLEGYLIDGDELEEMTPASPLIPGVLNRESYAILSGRDGSMKTFVALDWALSLATGTPWNNKPVFPIADRDRVLFLVGEGQAGFQKRVRAWKQAHGVDRLEGKFTALFRRINFFRDQPSVDWLAQKVTDGGYGLVVIDHLRLISGGADGNSSDMGVVVDNIKTLVEATLGGSVLLISHTDKADNDTRGFSGIEDDSDTVWHAKRTGEEDDAGALQGVRLKNTKQKDGEEHPEIELEPETVELGEHPETGLPITSLVLKPTDPFAPAEQSGPDRVLALIRRDYSAIGASQADIREALKMAKGTCNRYVNQLVESGALVRHGQKYLPAPGGTAGELTA